MPNTTYFDTDLEMIAALAGKLPEVSRIKTIGETVSVEYIHNNWRDEFSTVDEIIQALRA